MSILVMTTMTGTLIAKTIPKCSLVRRKYLIALIGKSFVAHLLIPIKPLFAATMSRQ